MDLKNIWNQKLKSMLTPVKRADTQIVLIVDECSTKILSSSMKIVELCEIGVPAIQNIEKSRQPLNMDAVYFISPTVQSVEKFISDFSDDPLYKCAHIFFTTICPQEIIDMITQSKVTNYIASCKVSYVDCVPIDKYAFTLGLNSSFKDIFSPDFSACSSIATKIFTLFVTLKELPQIRYQKNSKFAQQVATSLKDQCAKDATSLNLSLNQSTQLFICDRSIDITTMFLHDLTYQAMTVDLLEIKDSIYKFTNETGEVVETLLDDSDNIWTECKYQHIADVTKRVPELLKESGISKQTKEKKVTTTSDLAALLKKLPQHRQKLIQFCKHIQLAGSLMEKFDQLNLNQLCHAEQDLATKYDKDGIPVKDSVRLIMPILGKDVFRESDKLRVVLLHLINRCGDTLKNINNVASYGNLKDHQLYIDALAKMSVNLCCEPGTGYQPKLRKAKEGTTYSTSRYVPYVQDLMTSIINDNLETDIFALMSSNISPSNQQLDNDPKSSNLNFGKWHNQKQTQASKRMIVFIIGGMSYSELRSAHVISKNNKSWEIIIGSTEIYSPNSFLDALKSLN